MILKHVHALFVYVHAEPEDMFMGYGLCRLYIIIMCNNAVKSEEAG